MKKYLSFFKTSIGRKQIVAVTGLLLIGFIAGHLAGNLFIYGGPSALNSYAEHLAKLRPVLYFVELGLVFFFIVHVFFTALLVFENYTARPVKYKVSRSQGPRSLATRLMPYTGTIIFLFIIWHLMDFTFVDRTGPRSIMADGMSCGVYGVVYNSLSNPIHSIFYIIAMIAVGFHLSHAIQSFVETFGMNHPKYMPLVVVISNTAGVIVAAVFSSIPVYVYLK